MKTIARERGKKLLLDLVKNIEKTPVDAKIADIDKKDSFKGDGLAQILVDLEINKKDIEYKKKISKVNTKEINFKFENNFEWTKEHFDKSDIFISFK